MKERIQFLKSKGYFKDFTQEQIEKIIEDGSYSIEERGTSLNKRTFSIDVSGLNQYEVDEYMKNLFNNPKK